MNASVARMWKIRIHSNRLQALGQGTASRLDETLTLAKLRLGWKIAQQLGEQLRTGRLARLERITPGDEEAAWTIFTKFSDQRFSFTDCTSFELCNRLKLSCCLAIDKDFRTYGLHCIP